MNNQQQAQLPLPPELLRLGFPEYKLRIALARVGMSLPLTGDINVVGNYMLTNMDQPDHFWRPPAPAPAPPVSTPAPAAYAQHWSPPGAGGGTRGNKDDLLLAHLTGTVGLHPKTAKGYADGLVAEGFETPAAFDALSLEELRDDFGFLKGHVMAVRKYRETSPAAPQSPRSPQVGEPIGCAPPSHRALPTQQVPSLHALTIRLSTPQGQAPGRK